MARQGRHSGPGLAREPYPHDPARNAVERGISWLKHGRRVATMNINPNAAAHEILRHQLAQTRAARSHRYDKYAHHCLKSLYWVDILHCQNSKANTT